MKKIAPRGIYQKVPPTPNLECDTLECRSLIKGPDIARSRTMWHAIDPCHSRVWGLSGENVGHTHINGVSIHGLTAYGWVGMGH